MRYIIKEIDAAVESGRPWKTLGIQWELGLGYLRAIESCNDLPDLDIWCSENIPAIVADARRLGVKEITLSNGNIHFVEILAAFAAEGCSLDGIVQVREYRRANALIPAVKIRIN